MNLLTSAVRTLNAALKSTGGETITYRRGNDSIDIVAVPVRVRHDDYAPDEDLSLTARERDWIVWQEDLVIGGERLLPNKDDEIDWLDPLGVKHTYQVRPRDGDRCYRHTDQTLQQLRVYTVEALPNSE